jgi:hypothetical protein
MMKKKVFSVMAAGCFFGLLAATAHAQLPGTELRATIPFDFSIRGKTLPAGDYEIKRITDTPEVLIISSRVNDEHEIFDTELVEARKTPDRGELIFHRYGDSYFLSEVFAGGEQTGRELPVSRQEKTLRREIASNVNKAKPETVAVAVY